MCVFWNERNKTIQQQQQQHYYYISDSIVPNEWHEGIKVTLAYLIAIEENGFYFLFSWIHKKYKVKKLKDLKIFRVVRSGVREKYLSDTPKNTKKMPKRIPKIPSLSSKVPITELFSQHSISKIGVYCLLSYNVSLLYFQSTHFLLLDINKTPKQRVHFMDYIAKKMKLQKD